jgi:hypothetical protein
MYVCMYVSMHACMYVCVYVCMYVCMYVYMCVRMLYVCMHKHNIPIKAHIEAHGNTVVKMLSQFIDHLHINGRKLPPGGTWDLFQVFAGLVVGFLRFVHVCACV